MFGRDLPDSRRPNALINFSFNDHDRAASEGFEEIFAQSTKLLHPKRNADKIVVSGEKKHTTDNTCMREASISRERSTVYKQVNTEYKLLDGRSHSSPINNRT